MALTRKFRESSYVRAQRDEAFRKALLAQAVEAYLCDDELMGKTILRAMIDATIAFEQLASDLGKPSASVRRMLGARGNPSIDAFFAMLRALQKRLGVTLTVRAA